ncbi:MAG TPA: hypothetical protein VN310_14560 [Candidatus Dormibacteraeota bacterium]|jgi:hypothetical protein|nr:hypothetical protein [Candidatus Dormibacteraeota bacterium]
MIAMPLAFVVLLAVPQESVPQQQSQPTREQKLEQAREKYEPARQVAIHVNELAGNIHSEADARAFVDAVAERLTGNQHQSWTTRGIRHRVARAEYLAVSDPSQLIPEQRIVDIWNEYVRELDAPGETLVTVAELHNMRDAMYTGSQLMWKKEGFTQQFWTIPNVYGVDADRKVASGCRAVEALKLFHDMFYFFQMVQGARERVQKGILVSDLARQREQSGPPRPQVAKAQLSASRDTKPVLAAEIRYVQAHGEGDYRRLLERLFAELFPSE